MIQDVLPRLGVSKTRITPLYPQSYGMAEHIKTVEEHLRRVVASQQRNWDGRQPIFLLAYRASTHHTTGLTPASPVFGREPRMPCDLLFRAPSDQERPTIEHAENLVDYLHDLQKYGRQHLKMASDRMKTRYDKLASCAGCHEGDKIWLYRPSRMKGNSPKLPSSCEGLYKVITRM
jgi:hypothetical protein